MFGKIKFDKLGVKPDYYAYRIILILPRERSIRLHWWKSSDDPRALHCHPHWFWTLCLWGKYNDVGDCGKINHKMFPFKLKFIPANHKHSVQLKSKRVLTLLYCGPKERHWYFYNIESGKRKGRDRYFIEDGHWVEGKEPVKMKSK